MGLFLTDPIPDDTTVTRFRQKLQEKGLLEELFSILDSEFDRLGLLVDATIAQAQRRPPSKKEDDKGEKEERDLDAIQAHSSDREENPSLRHDDERIESKKRKTMPSKSPKTARPTMRQTPMRDGRSKAANPIMATRCTSIQMKALYADKAYDSEGVKKRC